MGEVTVVVVVPVGRIGEHEVNARVRDRRQHLAAIPVIDRDPTVVVIRSGHLLTPLRFSLAVYQHDRRT
jgi:hypothetical protein